MDTQADLNPIVKEEAPDIVHEDSDNDSEPLEVAKSEPHASAEEDSEPEPAATRTKLCNVCHEQEAKYKCPCERVA